jgi:hypothetical protein
MFLTKIPDRYFEMAGTVVGLSASAFIALQVMAELRNPDPSTLSPAYVAGFLLIFSFWALYGFRFSRMALWLTNVIAVVLQAALLVIILMK